MSPPKHLHRQGPKAFAAAFCAAAALVALALAGCGYVAVAFGLNGSYPHNSRWVPLISA